MTPTTSSVEPTTSATEKLRRLLDERGVEYVLDEEYGEKYPPEKRVTWSCDLAGEDMTVTARDYCININDDGSADYCLDLEFHEVFTVEQAIAATLGDVPRLPYFWTHDGTLHIELPKLPESISVRLPDQRDREVGSARTWQYTRDNGTRKAVYLLMATDIGDGREEVLGAYATESAAMKAISENQFGYALHHVRKWEVDE